MAKSTPPASKDKPPLSYRISFNTETTEENHSPDSELTREEVLELLGDNPYLSFSTFLKALSQKKDAYDHAAVAAAKCASFPDEFEVDDNAVTSRSDDDDGCYVMAWTWVPRSCIEVQP